MSLKKEFDENIRKALQKEMSVGSILAVPELEKVVINIGVGKMRENKTYIAEAEKDIEAIAGQRPVRKNAKVSISNFKLRQGQLAGFSVTLRGKKMWDFYEKLVTIVLPRVRDFRGVDIKSFDGSGNYSLGFSDHVAFPEIDPNKISHIKPLQVTIKTTARNDEDSTKLLKALGMPFRK